MVRLPMSIYSGWTTVITLLNTMYMLKSMGASDVIKVDPKANDGEGWANWANEFMFISEEDWTIIAIGAVEIFFELA